MAGYADIIRNGVATAKKITATLQPQITIQRWVGSNMSGKPEYLAAETFNVIVEKKNEAIKNFAGQETLSRAYILFIEPVPPTGVTTDPSGNPLTRREPIDENDKITLPDGDTGPILVTGGFFDPDTNHPYYYEVWLG